MVGVEALQSVQFVTVKGRRLAVLSTEDWEAFIEWVETLEDTQIARAAFAELKAAGGDRKRAGWLEWEDAEKELASGVCNHKRTMQWTCWPCVDARPMTTGTWKRCSESCSNSV